MSNIDLIIEERAVKIGGFLVGRLLPFRGKRMVGPFIYIDHMGPVTLGPYDNFDIPSHPHIGLSTLTYLFEGSIMHRDTLGTAMEIKPGAVNWMTAGKGIVHSERTPERLRNIDKSLHGLQIWVALPMHLEQMNPQFSHIPKEKLPSWTDGNVQYKLIAGEAFGHTSPVPVHSKLFMLEIKSSEKQLLNIGNELYGESGLYIMEGSVESQGNVYEPRQILVSEDPTLCSFTINAGSTIYLFGGDPFPEERFIEWNFVSSNPDLISRAKEKWRNQLFDKIPGERGFIPLPSLRV